MNFTYSQSATIKAYMPLWIKYRPVLLKLMIASQESTSEYQFYGHEFRQLNAREKGGYTFNLEVQKGKTQRLSKASPVAQDLMQVLEMSSRAVELMRENSYEFTMDRQFMFRVKRLSAPPVEEPTASPVVDDQA